MHWHSSPEAAWWEQGDEHGWIPQGHLQQLLCAEPFFLLATVPGPREGTGGQSAVGTAQGEDLPPGSAGTLLVPG